MKRRCKFLFLAALMIISSVLNVSAETETVATASFTAYDMTYYDEGDLYWYIGEAAASDTKIEEYGCVQNQYCMASSNAYAAIKGYELQTDGDFSFEGTASLLFSEGSGVDEDAAQIDFFVCTNKGKIIYPSDGSQFQSIKKEDGVVTISGEQKRMSAGDRIYFVALNSSKVAIQYLQFGMAVWETEYDQTREGSFSNTNAYSGNQGDDGWYFMCARTDNIQFGMVDVEIETVEKEEAFNDVSRYPEESGIVATTASEIVQAATTEDAKEPLLHMKCMITIIVAVGALLLIGQIYFLERWKKKREGDKK